MSWAREWGKKVGICQSCGEQIDFMRPDRALYCSNACKQRAYRERQAKGVSKKPKKKK